MNEPQRSQTSTASLSTSALLGPIGLVPRPPAARAFAWPTVPSHLRPQPRKPDPVNPTGLSQPSLTSERARTLLRRLRDLNLVAGPVALTREAWVSIAGCLSLDGPAEAGVRYLLRHVDGRERTLEIGWNGTGLVVSILGPGRDDRRDLRVPVGCDASGRACIPAIGARVRPDSNDPRELEHFLRRVVRAVAL